ncbi:MAG: thioredoxin [Solobacterium sp.]|jgi:thioredoxin 1|nr:thioredoxin [Solobacterium sp.]MCH4222837.1 thioredoxin [Solobacterium sp.]MCH4266625.1 thioredoxin [Solobacterium sp.]
MVTLINSKEEYDNILASNKSVFVDFFADWCGPCKMVGPLVEKISETNPDIKFVKVNVDSNPEIASMYGIMSIPTLIAFKDGKLAKQAVGFMQEADLQKLADTSK